MANLLPCFSPGKAIRYHADCNFSHCTVLLPFKVSHAFTAPTSYIDPLSLPLVHHFLFLIQMVDVVDIELWSRAAQAIDWSVPPRAVIEKDTSKRGPNPYVWFPGGRLNTCYNCLDRHDPNAVALIYDSPVTGNTKRSYTYGDILEQVIRLAGVLDSYGVAKGDTVLIYMPMVPEAVFCMLACARLGAVHSVVFGMCLYVCTSKALLRVT